MHKNELFLLKNCKNYPALEFLAIPLFDDLIQMLKCACQSSITMECHHNLQ